MDKSRSFCIVAVERLFALVMLVCIAWPLLLIALFIHLTHPDIVIIDDAWRRQEVIKRVRHLRTSKRLEFRILAVCWPFEKNEMKQALQVSANKIIELERLPRSTIVEIVQEVAALRKVTVNDEFLRVASKQARGLPGLAVSLTATAIDSSGEQLVSGNILLNQLGVFMHLRDLAVLLHTLQPPRQTDHVNTV